MLQFSSSPITPRPRPPRSRSSQLSSSTGSGTAGSPKCSSNPKAILCSKTTSDMILEAAANAVDTPPYTPEMIDVDQSANEDVSERPESLVRARSASELQRMLDEAHKVIQDRERDLGIAASLGKSLLDNNIALRARQDALAQRVQVSPEKAKTLLPRSSSQYVEARPPPSPRSSLSLPRSKGSVRFPTTLGRNREADWTDEETDDLRTSIRGHKRSARGGSTSSQPDFSPQKGFTPPRYHRRSSRGSSISSVQIVGLSAPSSVTPSRSASDRFLAHQAAVATPLQLQHQHAELAAQNAELERQLQELESELSRADVTGKKKLRRLDKELGSLRAELESALERNKDLEERLGKSSGMSTSTSLTRVGDEAHIKSWTMTTRLAAPAHDDAWLADLLDRATSHQPTDTDQVDPDAEQQEELPTYKPRMTLPKFASSPANLSRYLAGSVSSKEADLVGQLIEKIAELQKTTLDMAEEKAHTDLRLAEAEAESDGIRRRYEMLEEKVQAVEILDRSSPLRKQRESLQWNSPSRSSVFDGSPQRRAPGNRTTIERHRRLSGVQQSRFLSPNDAASPEKRRYGSLSESGSPSRLVPPAALQRSVSTSSRLSVSPSRSVRPSLSRSASNVSEFFENDGWDREQDLASGGAPNEHDLLHSIRQRNTADRDLLRKSQHLLKQDDAASIGETSEDWRRMYDFKTSISPSTSFSDISRQSISPSNSLKKLGHGQHTLASELGALWAADESANMDEEDVLASTIVLNSSRASAAPSLALVPRNTDVGIVKRCQHSLPEEEENDDENVFRALLSSGPPDAESYDSLHLALHDLPITWADDIPLPIARLTIKDIERVVDGRKLKDEWSHAGWIYEDPEDSNSDNDPWKEEEEAAARAKTAAQLTVESREAVEAREQADERAARRRRRLQELAREMMADDEDEVDEYSEESWEKKMRALRRLGSESSLEAMDQEAREAGQMVLHDAEDSQGHAGHEKYATDGFELVSTTRRAGARGTDYWPVSLRARYAPSMVALRVRTTTQEYANFVLLWTRFLVVLAVAVAFSLWRGPRSALGLTSSRSPPRKQNTRERARSSPRRVSLILDKSRAK